MDLIGYEVIFENTAYRQTGHGLVRLHRYQRDVNINDSIPSFIVVGGNQAMVDRKLQSGESGEGYKVSKFFLKLGTKMCFV